MNFEGTDIDGIVAEMRALVRFWEQTTNPILREVVKRRLKLLSEIPEDNDFGLDQLDLYLDEMNHDHSRKFSPKQQAMFRDYFDNPDLGNAELGERHGMSTQTVSLSITKFMGLTGGERQLILNK